MRLLVWNIQFFSLNKIAQPPLAPIHPMQTKTPESAWRNLHILNHVGSGAPDVFIVIENLSGKGARGGLATGDGAAAALLLLQYLRAVDAAADWCLVPPLRLIGAIPVENERPYTEVVSVFYRNSALDFRGPFVWPKDAPPSGEKVALPAPATAGPYPDPWANALPAGNHFAGQYLFARSDGSPLEFGGDYQRNPFLTTFAERAGARRVVNIVTSHPKPTGTDKVTAAAQLGAIGTIAAIPANTVDVLCGDFNIDIAGRADDQFGGTGYEVLTGMMEDGVGYEVLVQPSAGATTILNVGSATAAGYKKPQSLDNVLVRYGTGARAAAPSATIVDMVAGVAGYPSDMADALGTIGTDDGLFRRLDNYGHIGAWPGTSDHLAISADL